MSADTRRKRCERPEETVTKLTQNCLALMGQQKRSVSMVQALARSLQLFKENKLAGAIALPGTDVIDDVSQLHSLFSMEVAYSGMDSKLVRYCYERGILYVGEIYRLVDSFSRQTEYQDQLRSFLLLNRLPTTFDIVSSSWKIP